MEAPCRHPDHPQDSHTVVFNAARILIHGFGFSQAGAFPLLADYLKRSDEPWTEAEIHHKLQSVDAIPTPEGRGHLLGDIGIQPGTKFKEAHGILSETDRKKKVEFDAEKLAAIATPWHSTVDLVWLANRSAVDPATLDPAGYLRLMYSKGEKVLVFTDEMTQGDALWPKDELPEGGRCGVWFLPQPVDGEYHPNPRSRTKDGKAKLSRRSEESVKEYRYMLLESDEANPRDWLGFIVQVPLRIEALYTSGGRSVHALVRVDCRTKEQWDAEKKALMPFLMAGLMLGADRGTWSGVRLSRLPGCWRHGKQSRGKGYTRYPTPRLQKLLYVRPGADGRPICEQPAVRDVTKHWVSQADLIFDGYESKSGLEPLLHALRYYAPVSGSGEPFKEALAALEDVPS